MSQTTTLPLFKGVVQLSIIRSSLYILKNKKVVKPKSLREWEDFMSGHNKRIVSDTQVGSIHVSTVFTGIDHSYLPNTSPPLVFETMVFGDCEINEHQVRYRSYEEAERGHRVVVSLVSALTGYKIIRQSRVPGERLLRKLDCS